MIKNSTLFDSYTSTPLPCSWTLELSKQKFVILKDIKTIFKNITRHYLCLRVTDKRNHYLYWKCFGVYFLPHLKLWGWNDDDDLFEVFSNRRKTERLLSLSLFNRHDRFPNRCKNTFVFRAWRVKSQVNIFSTLRLALFENIRMAGMTSSFLKIFLYTIF